MTTKRKPAPNGGLPIRHKTPAVKVHFYLEKTDADLVKKFADKYNCSQSEFIRAMVRDHAKANGGGK